MTRYFFVFLKQIIVGGEREVGGDLLPIYAIQHSFKGQDGDSQVCPGIHSKGRLHVLYGSERHMLPDLHPSRI